MRILLGTPRSAAATVFGLLLVLVLVFGSTAFGQLHIDIEKPPFSYSETHESNAITDLMQALKDGTRKLEFDQELGYLPAILDALDIPISSQVLVFSKTSLQVRYISRRNPRAIYFNDDVYVGWVRGSSLMELSTSDPQLGAAFYLVDMQPWRANIRRTDYECLGCHSTSMTGGLPGHTVRSVMPTHDGNLAPQTESYVTDHTTPLAQRFGGWYVTGQHGAAEHMGNSVFRASRMDNRDAFNRSDLREFFDTSKWIAPHSDLVALMVLEHQTQMHNLLTQADFTTRKLIYDSELIDTADDKADATNAPSRRDQQSEVAEGIRQAAERVVEGLLFKDEFQLTSPVSGSSSFAHDFASRGPTDAAGRSLRQFNLQTRLFEYPCSFLIYSAAFEQLQPQLKSAIYIELRSVLRSTPSQDASEPFPHLGSEQRRAILEILSETQADFAVAHNDG